MVKKHSTSFLLFIISIILVFSAANVKWGGERWHSIIRDDGKGYYAYLPAIFIYQDLSFGFYDKIENEKYFIPQLVFDYRNEYQGSIVNKYYVGTAIAELPFFLMAHALSEPMGYDSDGYSKIYYVFVNIAGLFYMVLGLYLLWKILLLYQIKKSNINIVLLSIGLGTHLFYYAAFEPCMSHVYSFAAVNAFVLWSKKCFIEAKSKYLIIAALMFGMIVLIRPVNGLVILALPFVSGSFPVFKQRLQELFTKKYLATIGALLSVFGVLFIQGIIYYLQTGHFIIYSYGTDHFDFLDSHMIDILFSYKKGLFLYTPICLLACFGSYYLFLKNKFHFFSLLAFFLVLTYVLASWWSWWYGGSFSSRVYVEYLFVFAILLAFALEHITIKKWRNLFMASLFFLILFNQKQTYLYRIGHIHFVDMDKEWYWNSIIDPLKLK
ncbi:hypothetical protein [Lentimicrobium sp. S6]|uniref:hypothetical protein n=1 Tax=Lentimicrobium sp. S6 TaxID=2735872 RepID=UPI0015563479|nr:hypothetical protein [Lentimicrobium sp. S6]NPD44754.1 hypothetical protein [Lentimicrobium sp. S6]NPD83390.1 hypothetical protein [Lentimicrobium sp. L6]